MGHDHEAVCECVADHNPNPMELHKHHIWPLYLGGPDTEDNIVWLCPTSHTNVHELLREWVKRDAAPPWDVQKRYSAFVHNLAAEGYSRWKTGQ